MKRKTILKLSGLAFVLTVAFGCHEWRDIPYPKPYPDSSAIRFLPGLVSIDGLDFNSAFSPDGQSFYFSRSQNGQWDIFVSHYTEHSWTTPVRTSFCDEKYSEADPAFSPDGKLFFISNRPRQGETMRKDFDIWYVEENDAGGWDGATNAAAVNSDSSEYYVSFSANGNLYFGSSRPGGYGQEDIYVSRFVNGAYANPENLGAKINSSESEHDPCISGDERLIIFKSENREDGFGEGDLYFSTVDDDKQSWNSAQNLGAKINTKSYEYCPYFSPDGKYFFFSSQYDIMWMDMHVLRRIIRR